MPRGSPYTDIFNEGYESVGKSKMLDKFIYIIFTE